VREAGAQALRTEEVDKGQEELDEGQREMSRRRPHRITVRSLLAGAAVSLLFAALAGATPALAGASPLPHWKLESIAAPTDLPLKGGGPNHGEAIIEVAAANLGDAEAHGESATNEIVLTDALPSGLEVIGLEGRIEGNKRSAELGNAVSCPKPPFTQVLTCTYSGKLPPYEELAMIIRVKVNLTSPAELHGQVTVTGGEATPDSLEQSLAVNGEATPFGAAQYELNPENEDGSPDAEAGSHPFQMTTTFDLNRNLALNPENGATFEPSAPALAKNLSFKLPPGLVGDTTAVAQCTDLEFGTSDAQETDSCPPETAVGMAVVTFYDPILLHRFTDAVPVFNLVPAPGEPARFGIYTAHIPIVLDTSVRTGEGYGVTVSTLNTTQAVQLLGSRVTIWGVPDERSHDESRGWGCLGYDNPQKKCEPPATSPTAFLTLPTSCAAEPPETSVEGDSWPTAAKPEGYALAQPPRAPLMEQLTGCASLPFSPSISVAPETETADAPSGLSVHIHVPQQTTLEAAGKAESAVEDTTVKLPLGVMLSPSAANGLEACAEGETEAPGGIGFTGFGRFEGTEMQTYTQKLPEPLEPGTNFCPNASKVGVVHIKTPDLPNELVGGVYIAKQNENPFGSLFAMYIVAQDPVSKVLVKLAGEVNVGPTGQITSTVENAPDVPFEELTIELFGGPRASLTTPPSCGEYPSEAQFTSWSGTETRPEPPPTFNITSCASQTPFAPTFSAGSTNSQAGAFTPFTLTIGVPQADAALKAISNMQLPPGLAAILASVTPCPEPQAAEGNCSAESEIGVSTAVSGLGEDPYSLPGKVYLTGPYDGAPFGLSAVTLAKAGPFHLGRVVVRSSIAINENTAAATINTEAARFINEKGEATELSGLPEFIEGVPSQLKQLNVTIDRPDFEFNPTNCAQTAITATLKSSLESAAVSSPFYASNCAALPFAPRLKASVAGQGSKADGTTFIVTVESPGLGQANIHKVDLTIPASLPSRLETLQKACVEKVFDANPASCDEGSVIGEGIVHTPVFKNPLRGPAYLVSHGGAAFPDVEFVLQGEGVTIVLDGKTDITEGVTYSKFETAPDAPFTKFESIFPAGPHGVLTPHVAESEHYNLCKTSLVLPTELTGQNGAFISKTTKVEVTGCGAVKSFKATKAQLLAKALKACKKDKKKSRRVACERAARKKYASTKAKKPAKKPSKK
jgi:hypothetical protein